MKKTYARINSVIVGTMKNLVIKQRNASVNAAGKKRMKQQKLTITELSTGTSSNPFYVKDLQNNI